MYEHLEPLKQKLLSLPEQAAPFPWKLITAIINCWMACNIKLHNTHHGFHPGRGTGTAIMETKIHMQLAHW